MKLKATFSVSAISLLSSITLGGMVQIKDQLKQLLSSVPNDRKMSDIFNADFLEQINHWGCWCYFDPEDFGRGRGC